MKESPKQSAEPAGKNETLEYTVTADTGQEGRGACHATGITGWENGERCC